MREAASVARGSLTSVQTKTAATKHKRVSIGSFENVFQIVLLIGLADSIILYNGQQLLTGLVSSENI